ncbi:MAG: hypothetical protein J7M25_15885 [Deltaproteobacteria bacterium]|nr:hypothetical protein [Deltaproteobacteria bacterium]
MTISATCLFLLFGTIAAPHTPPTATARRPNRQTTHHEATVSRPPLGRMIHIPYLPGFQERCTRWFCFRYPEELSSAAEVLARNSHWVVATVSFLLGEARPKTTIVALSRTRVEFLALMPAGVRLPRWAAAVALPRLAYIAFAPIGVGRTKQSLVRLFIHEYSHVVLRVATNHHRLPAWFVEGLAELQAQRVRMPSAYATEPELPLDLLARRFPRRSDRASAAYSQSRDFVAYLYAVGTPQDFRRMIHLVGRGKTLRQAVHVVYGTDIKILERSWRASWRYRNVVLPLFTSGALLWILASILLLAGYRKRRRLLAMADMTDTTEEQDVEEERDENLLDEDQETEEEEEEEPRGPQWDIPPVVVLLIGLGLTLMAAAVVRPIWPRVRWSTLTLGAGILTALFLLWFWRRK